MKEAGGKYVNTLIKAEEYKQKVEAGSLEIHKLDDARAEPPRGFKRLAMTQTDGEAIILYILTRSTGFQSVWDKIGCARSQL